MLGHLSSSLFCGAIFWDPRVLFRRDREGGRMNQEPHPSKSSLCGAPDPVVSTSLLVLWSRTLCIVVSRCAWRWCAAQRGRGRHACKGSVRRSRRNHTALRVQGSRPGSGVSSLRVRRCAPRYRRTQSRGRSRGRLCRGSSCGCRRARSRCCGPPRHLRSRRIGCLSGRRILSGECLVIGA